MADLRYPIGRFEYDPGITPAKRISWIDEIRAAPGVLSESVRGLTDEQLDTAYRDGGWTLRQVVHHLVDSHLNAYARFRWALTEPEPAIKNYDEKGWAELADARQGPPELSLLLFEMLHARLVILLDSLHPADFERMLVHPERGRISLDVMLQIYAWHGRHHAAHIRSLRDRRGWA